MIAQSVVLDASTLLNLFATGNAGEILGCLTGTRFVCSVVESEVLHLRSEEPTKPPEPVLIDDLVSTGLLTRTEPENSHEESLYVEFASMLDDGEAMSLALCVSRSFWLATDDKKARRISASLSPPVPLLSTSELVKEWARETEVSRETLRKALLAIERRARFVPWQGYPEKEWWSSVVSAEGSRTAK